MCTIVVAEENTKEILEIQKVSGRFEVWEDDGIQIFNENRTSDVGCVI
jgi:hypothetical protein